MKTEIEPPFESRDVQIRRGLNVRDFFEMEEEIGRYEFSLFFIISLYFFFVNSWFYCIAQRQIRDCIQMPGKENWSSPCG